MASKIESKLTPLQVAELLEELSKTEGGAKHRDQRPSWAARASATTCLKPS